MEKIAIRSYAHPFDRPVQGDADQHGVGRNSDAIGGYNGMGWYSYFRDHRTGEIFRVHCSDGVYGGKDAYPDSILPWMEERRNAIARRTIAEAKAGATEIRISTPEWNLMLGRVHDGWLDLQPGQKYADGNRSLDEGVVGFCHGVPVIVDPGLQSPLGDPPTNMF